MTNGANFYAIMVTLLSMTLALYVITPIAAQSHAISADAWKRGAMKLTGDIQRRLVHIEAKLDQQPLTPGVLAESDRIQKLAIVTRKDLANQVTARLDRIDQRLAAIEQRLH